MRTALLLAVVSLFAQSAGAQEIGRPIEEGDGVMVVAEGGLRMCVLMVDHHMRVAFVDESGLVIECPFEKVIVHAERMGNDDKYHLVMRPEPGKGYLTHQRVITPPENFELRVILYPEEDTESGRIVIPRIRFR